MPRKKFIQDLESAQASGTNGDIYDLQRGEDDGTFTFVITHDKLDQPATVNVMINELSDYPSRHEYMIYTSDDTPNHVGQVLQDHLPSTTSKSIQELFQCIRLALNKVDSDTQDSDLQSEDDNDDDEDASAWDPDEEYVNAPIHDHGRRTSSGLPMPAPVANKIRQDLRAVKEAGFRVGIIGHIFTQNTPGIISISCKVKKLGISQEAMKAWQLRPNEYLILLIRYPNGYRNADDIKQGKRNMFEVRLRVCDTYKPSQQEAVNTFVMTQKDMEDQAGTGVKQHSRDTFISSTINTLVGERLAKLMMYRDEGLTWAGAEQFYSDVQGRPHDKLRYDQYKRIGKHGDHGAFPDIVRADHLASTRSVHMSVSFPLVAMQFALRHFVRCTEFCLICHRTLPREIEALKPYVCDNPLCLYQYMSLGFGPSIDHEIITQPLVIDLLVSFCYSSAANGVLKDFPVGLAITVPLSFAHFNSGALTKIGKNSNDGRGSHEHKAKIDQTTFEMLLDDASVACPFVPGDWVICRPEQGSARPLHFRVAETTYYPTIKVGQPVSVAITSQDAPEPRSAPAYRPNAPQADTTPTMMAAEGWVDVFVQKYDIDIDTLEDQNKRVAIKFLLDTLPNVNEMQQYIQQSGNKKLGTWIDRISPSAASVLRWIIASNRACIVQVDERAPLGSDGQDIPAYMAKQSEGEYEKEERVQGMRGWMQFRFAMGAPDKEQRFLQQVRSTSQRLNSKFPTIFAWHGSRIGNWHSIIREGLHFKNVLNGRAFGDGVYHSQELRTSLGYCQSYHSYGGITPGGVDWPSSILQITTALSLNELVNAPEEYVKAQPHLVIANLDWIQTRYLFVKLKSTTTFLLEIEATINDPLPLDPCMFPKGEEGALELPMSATKVLATGATPRKRKSPKSSSAKAMVKKSLRGSGTRDDPMDLDEDDRSSVATDDDDQQALIDMVDIIEIDDEPSPTLGAQRNDSTIDLFAMTKYRPGQLDFSTLPQMPEPTYASVVNSKRLQNDFKTLLKLQQSTPAHELGWYIDPDKIENMYQWIVEMHSFDNFVQPNGQPILLAGDMDRAKITSIVFEIRFGPNYPFQPPFVRIIRPRFLGFREGGGGHVTIGGALCMELLTNTGWTSVSSIEAVLMQIRLAIGTTEPPARLMMSTNNHGGVAHTSDYGVHEAIEAYKRACRTHGWDVPEDLKTLQADYAKAGIN
ncbi:hypothetical protein KVT40_002883 [Elsinoe batatas]|uniref:UBC core domain-containing protein n=1 Tax=Elsinoe batatas TaxID=2601811 RepID=A0A8K0LB51_9PEZI|nr:hypothetical protein KVT40_002883 [Elsinoe batatas]